MKLPNLHRMPSLKKYSDCKKIQLPLALFGKFFFGDVAFTILPLVVIIFLNLALERPAEDIPFYSEWSFATIVLIGLALTRILELKMLYQRDKSYRVFTLSKICILLMIGAVISLSLSQLRPYGIDVSPKYLLLLQFTMFIMGFIMLFIAHYAREIHIRDENYLPVNIGLIRYYRFMYDSLRNMNSELNYLHDALSRREQYGFLDNEHKDDFEIIASQREKEIKHYFKQLEVSFAQLRDEFSDLD